MSALQCKLVNSCVLFHFAASDETIANCLLERIPWLYLIMVGLTLLVLTLISASTIAHQHRHKKALPSPDEEQHHHNNHHHHHNFHVHDHHHLPFHDQHQLPDIKNISLTDIKKQKKKTKSVLGGPKTRRASSTRESILQVKDNHHRLSAYTPEEYTDMDFETTV